MRLPAPPTRAHAPGDRPARRVAPPSRSRKYAPGNRTDSGAYFLDRLGVVGDGQYWRHVASLASLRWRDAALRRRDHRAVRGGAADLAAGQLRDQPGRGGHAGRLLGRPVGPRGQAGLRDSADALRRAPGRCRHAARRGLPSGTARRRSAERGGWSTGRVEYPTLVVVSRTLDLDPAQPGAGRRAGTADRADRRTRRRPRRGGGWRRSRTSSPIARRSRRRRSPSCANGDTTADPQRGRPAACSAR